MSYDPKSANLTPNASTGELDTLIDLLQVWQRKVVTNDVTTDQATMQDITALGFTPIANKTYLVDGTLLIQTASALVGPAISWTGPTGLTDSAFVIEGPTAATTYTARATTGLGGLALSLATLPTANESYIIRLRGLVRVGASPGAGNIRPQFCSTIVATNQTIRAGSCVLYRVVS